MSQSQHVPPLERVSTFGKLGCKIWNLWEDLTALRALKAHRDSFNNLFSKFSNRLNFLAKFQDVVHVYNMNVSHFIHRQLASKSFIHEILTLSYTLKASYSNRLTRPKFIWLVLAQKGPSNSTFAYWSFIWLVTSQRGVASQAG